MKRFLSIIVLLGVCIHCFAQANIVVPNNKSAHSNSSSNSTNNGSVPKPVQNKPTIRLRLAGEIDGERCYFTQQEWKKMSEEEKVKVNKIGIVVGTGSDAFLISLYNNMGRHLFDSTYLFSVATNKTGGQLPTRAQLGVLSKYRSTIEWSFGGEGYSYSKLWCKEGYCLDMKTNTISSDSKASFRIATNDIENGFKIFAVNKTDGEDYDYMGSKPSLRDELQLVGLRNKYGFIDSKGNIAIPIMYDDINCGTPLGKYSDGWWNEDKVLSVSINSKWGYINKSGKEIVPIYYDKVDGQCCTYSSDNFERFARVYKEEFVGAVNINGEFVIPIEYDIIEKSSGNEMIFAKKNGKYGFLNSLYDIAIPFKYDHVGGFNYSECKSDTLSSVGLYLNGKMRYGYIDKTGKEVIPLIYDFADRFHNGLAAVVKDKKLGFINIIGDIIIPFKYEIPYHVYTDDNDRHLEVMFLGGDFYSPYIAFVFSNGKYAIINKKGELISGFKYDDIKQRTGGKYDVSYVVSCGNTTLYIDMGGNEYSSWEDLHKNSTKKLAEQGIPYAQYNYGVELLNKGDIEQAQKWLVEAGNNGLPNSFGRLGDYYKKNINKNEASFNNAITFYETAVSNGDIDSYLSLGHLLFDKKEQYADSYYRASIALSRYIQAPNEEARQKFDAYYYLGMIYYYGGYGIQKSYDDAFEYFSKSGTSDAKYFIGWMYEHGQGVSVDKQKAIEFYKNSYGRRDSETRISKLQANL